VFSSDDCILTDKIWDSVIEWKLQEFERKKALQLLGESSPMLSPTSGLQRTSKIDTSEQGNSETKLSQLQSPPSPSSSSLSNITNVSTPIKENEINSSTTSMVTNEKLTAKQKKKNKQQSKPKPAMLSPQQTKSLKEGQSKVNILSAKMTPTGEQFQVSFEVAGETESFWCSKDELVANYASVIADFQNQNGILE